MSCNDYRREFKPYCHTYKDGMILWMNSIKDNLIEAGRGEGERRGEGRGDIEMQGGVGREKGRGERERRRGGREKWRETGRGGEKETEGREGLHPISPKVRRFTSPNVL